ncbi:hypothetical protein ACIPSK_10100 [Rhizobium sp. LARHSG275]|uniref:hypothetical protein n=1 Tax=Rhizobium TaxID=379 RepID=UPI001FEED1DC|nr:hypothetical protein [Rhizobium laguerreae]
MTEDPITAALCHPLDQISDELIATMIAALAHRDSSTILSKRLRPKAFELPGFGNGGWPERPAAV